MFHRVFTVDEANRQIEDGYRGRRPVTPDPSEVMGRDDDRGTLDDSRRDF